MCHLILLMPVLALPIFWLIPLNLAIPIYIIIALMSGLFYRLIAKSMSKQPETGSEGLIGATAEVVSKLNLGDLAQYLVRSHLRASGKRAVLAVTAGAGDSASHISYLGRYPYIPFKEGRRKE